jgi:hypothetical protein
MRGFDSSRACGRIPTGCRRACGWGVVDGFRREEPRFSGPGPGPNRMPSGMVGVVRWFIEKGFPQAHGQVSTGCRRAWLGWSTGSSRRGLHSSLVAELDGGSLRRWHPWRLPPGGAFSAEERIVGGGSPVGFGVQRPTCGRSYTNPAPRIPFRTPEPLRTSAAVKGPRWVHVGRGLRRR